MGNIQMGKRNLGSMKVSSMESFLIYGKHRFILQNIFTGEKKIFEYENLVTTAGKTMIAKRLAGEANDCNITYAAVGTNATVPVIADVKLGTELLRKTLTSNSYSGAIAYITSYFGASEANGALKEFGLFGEAASSTPDSGTLFNHAAINITKTSSYTMTIESTITIG
jgi:hypothetical protein